MSIKKIAIAGITGGAVYFILGWLLYGMLLKDFYSTHLNNSISRSDTEMIWWAAIASNFLWGILMAYIFSRWANITTFSAGLSAGAMILLLMGLASGLGFYAFSTMYNDMTGLITDIAVKVAIGAIVGAIVGFVLGKTKD